MHQLSRSTQISFKAFTIEVTTFTTQTCSLLANCCTIALWTLLDTCSCAAWTSTTLMVLSDRPTIRKMTSTRRSCFPLFFTSSLHAFVWEQNKIWVRLRARQSFNTARVVLILGLRHSDTISTTGIQRIKLGFCLRLQIVALCRSGPLAKTLFSSGALVFGHGLYSLHSLQSTSLLIFVFSTMTLKSYSSMLLPHLLK